MAQRLRRSVRKTIVIIALAAAILAVVLFFWMPSRHPDPQWVRDIRHQVDPSLCSADNCEACPKASCTFDGCGIAQARYSCGPSCDAGISWCATLETGPDTFCADDAACWCRRFDGARFLPGRSRHRCDQQTMRCEQCYYE